MPPLQDQFCKFAQHLDQYKQVTLRLGWMLYLVLKAKLLPRFPDLVR